MLFLSYIYSKTKGISFNYNNQHGLCGLFDHTHARARLAPQISKLSPNPLGGWDLARSRVFSQVDCNFVRPVEKLLKL